MPVPVVRLTRSQNAAGELVVRLGVRLLDKYLEFLAGEMGLASIALYSSSVNRTDSLRFRASSPLTVTASKNTTLPSSPTNPPGV